MAIKLDELAQLGRLEKEFEIVKGLKIKLHTLSMQEQNIALKSVPASLTDPSAMFHHLQKALLIQATDLVNGEKATAEELEKLYNDLQESIFQEISGAYISLRDDANKVLEELKKKI